MCQNSRKVFTVFSKECYKYMNLIKGLISSQVPNKTAFQNSIFVKGLCLSIMRVKYGSQI